MDNLHPVEREERQFRNAKLRKEKEQREREAETSARIHEAAAAMRGTSPPVFTIEQLMDASSDYGGFCTACGEQAYNVEPDACKYTCESCGEPEVYGAEELVMMGHGQ